VRIELGSSVSALLSSGSRVEQVLLADGRRIAADLVIVGIGVVPNLELARDAGLAVGNGFAVDECLRTSDPRVFAIGDCAEYPNSFSGSRVRLESVQNAVDQAMCVAKAITGHPAEYHAAPWFWTDQFDIRLQMTGLGSSADQWILRGDVKDRKFSLFYFRERRLLAVDSVNKPADHLAARKLIASRAALTPEQANDATLDLKAFVAQAS
jgi:3-phenylpropionate/trans-cinnamate dioxygenase ferredoxin reductase subunit